MRKVAVSAIVIMLASSQTLRAEEVQQWLPSTEDTGGDETSPTEGSVSNGNSRTRSFIETSGYWLQGRHDVEGRWQANLGADVQYTQDLNSQWRVAANGRLDYDAYSISGRQDSDDLTLTLRELYVSRSWSSGAIVEFGRINVRDGVGVGFNPTDVFRVGALLARRTEDPIRLRESRVGAVGLRAQIPLGASSVSVLIAPRIRDSVDYAWYDARFGAVNRSAQAYLKFVPPTWEGAYSNVVLHSDQDGRRTVGLNLNRNLGQAVTAYIEYARARQLPLVAEMQPQSGYEWNNQMALGASYTTQRRVTFQLEYQYNGFGLDTNRWNNAWSTLSEQQLGELFADASDRQDPTSRGSWLGMVTWNQIGGRNSQLDCLLRKNDHDSSHFAWCQWGRQWQRFDLLIQAGGSNGARRSEFGASNTAWSTGLVMKVYL